MAANPRAAAVAALVRQEQDGFSNLVLDAELKRQQLEGRDKAFASAIFYTVLEHRGTLDYILCQFLPKGLAKLDAPVREILRAALAQARYMQVPASAAVNEAVKLTRTFKKASASGLVNAVLRRAIGYDLGSAVFADEVERLYARMGQHFRSLEPWQVYVLTSSERFERLYGRRADKVRKLYNGMIPCFLYQYFKFDRPEG